ncbi:hypothetical protein [Nonomuraea candida]|uniref:hypothetical protein n=1 Tax=Nonomuraea candida TaxID=359159 RepID=UPI0005BB1C07|nr:hypothetical protein [Nonomuraea candida]
MSARIEPDLHRVEVPEDKWALLEGTRLEYAPIGDVDDYAVRVKDRPEDEIRQAGDAFRKLGAVLGRGVGVEQVTDGVDLYEYDVDEGVYQAVEGMGLEYAPVNDHDAYSVRDQEHPGDLRASGDDWRKLGMIL